jgi:hypothetical protein
MKELREQDQLLAVFQLAILIKTLGGIAAENLGARQT